MPNLTGNKGEWSEVYALFKLLSDGKVYASNADLQKNQDLFFPIIAIIREDGGEPKEYKIDEDSGKVSVFIEGSRVSVL